MLRYMHVLKLPTLLISTYNHASCYFRKRIICGFDDGFVDPYPFTCFSVFSFSIKFQNISKHFAHFVHLVLVSVMTAIAK